MTPPPWLDVIGMGEDGWTGLAPTARAALEAAEVIIAGPRLMGYLPELPAERVFWPTPFRDLAAEIGAWRGRRVAVLVTGDPLWYSAGALFLRSFAPDELTFHPSLSSFQLAAARMKWSLADVETLTIHGRPAEQAIPFFAHGLRLLILTQDGRSPAKVASMLTENGLGESRLTVLSALGSDDEERIEGRADGWTAEVSDFHVLAVDCRGDGSRPVLPRTGLPDDAFVHDGRITKREVRALTLSALAPRRGQLLWDIGTGCGSVAVEWMRADRDMRAIGIDRSRARLATAAANSVRLGAPRIDFRPGEVPECLADLPVPDAVFIGGGLSARMVAAVLEVLPGHGRLVANAVTLEREAILAEMHRRHGGDLVRLAVSRAEAVGPYRGWKPLMPITQWSLTR